MDIRCSFEYDQYDSIGVGFGPSNLALAIALKHETCLRGLDYRFHFIERQAQFSWHRGMLLPGSNMQISFLKDLVSPRDPTNYFTFINYLHKHGRLEKFSNCDRFFPSREEFNRYLEWAASSFSDNCSYSEDVIRVDPVFSSANVVMLKIVSQDKDGIIVSRLARNLAIALGGTPLYPEVFKHHQNDKKIIHSSQYLTQIRQLRVNDGSARIAVIGGGQSAAEIFLDLTDRYPKSQIDIIFRGDCLKPADGSPFVNEIFDPTYTDFIYRQRAVQRDSILAGFRNTNYGVVEQSLLEQIYRKFYRDSMMELFRLKQFPASEIKSVSLSDSTVALKVFNEYSGDEFCAQYDAVVLATGYRRQNIPEILAPILEYMVDRVPTRDYSLPMISNFQPRIYLQGHCENTHGLSDTLLSLAAVRAGEITSSLLS